MLNTDYRLNTLLTQFPPTFKFSKLTDTVSWSYARLRVVLAPDLFLRTGDEDRAYRSFGGYPEGWLNLRVKLQNLMVTSETIASQSSIPVHQ